jgi:iron complex outermembrane receptor protein
MKAFCVAALTAVLLPAALVAQARDTVRSDTSVFRVGELRVQATRPVTTVGGASALEVRLDSMDLPAAPTFEAVLRELPMLHIRTNSRGEAEISVRGSESRQVAVLVDGVPLTLAWDARADYSVIPAAAPQELSFIRGLSSMLYGPNVLGGIVEVGVGKSFHQPADMSMQLIAGGDDVGGYSGSASANVPVQTGSARWLVRVGAAFRDSPGQPLARNVVEPVAASEAGLRLNTDAQNRNGFLAVRYLGNGGAWFSLSGSAFRAERGIAAELGVDNARFWRYPEISRTIAVASGGTGDRASPLGGRGDVEVSLGVDAGRTNIDSYTSRQYDQTSSFENGEDRTLTLRLLADQSVGGRGELRGAFTLSEIRHDEFLPDGGARYRQRLMSFGAENNWRLIQNGSGINTLRLSLGGAFDLAETPESGGREPQGRLDQWGGRLGLTAAARGGNLILHAGVSRRGRFPALRELYSGALERFQPNPNLKPERLTAFEAGATTRLGEGSLQAVAFRHKLEDAVVRITLPDRRFLRVNRNELTSTGLEFLLTQSLGPVRLSGDVTLQSVDLTDTEAGLTNRPENLPELFGSISARFPLVLGLNATAEANHIGDQFCIDPGTGNDAELEAGTQFNIDLGRVFTFRQVGSSLFTSLEGRIAVDNVGDGARYDQCGLPQPGRLLRFQVRLF